MYKADPSKKKAAAATLYKLQSEKKMESSKAYYCSHKAQKKAPTRWRGMLLIELLLYRTNAEKRKAAAKAYYTANPEPKCAASRTVYRSKPAAEVMKETFRKYHATHKGVRLQYSQKYHCYTKRVKVTKARYSLIQPTQLLIECFRLMQANLLTEI